MIESRIAREQRDLLEAIREQAKPNIARGISNGLCSALLFFNAFDRGITHKVDGVSLLTIGSLSLIGASLLLLSALMQFFPTKKDKMLLLLAERTLKNPTAERSPTTTSIYET